MALTCEEPKSRQRHEEQDDFGERLLGQNPVEPHPQKNPDGDRGKQLNPKSQTLPVYEPHSPVGQNFARVSDEIEERRCPDEDSV